MNLHAISKSDFVTQQIKHAGISGALQGVRRLCWADAQRRAAVAFLAQSRNGQVSHNKLIFWNCEKVVENDALVEPPPKKQNQIVPF
jgi:hypothetical protein